MKIYPQNDNVTAPPDQNGSSDFGEARSWQQRNRLNYSPFRVRVSLAGAFVGFPGPRLWRLRVTWATTKTKGAGALREKILHWNFVLVPKGCGCSLETGSHSQFAMEIRQRNPRKSAACAADLANQYSSPDLLRGSLSGNEGADWKVLEKDQGRVPGFGPPGICFLTRFQVTVFKGAIIFFKRFSQHLMQFLLKLRSGFIDWEFGLCSLMNADFGDYLIPNEL